MVDAEVLEHCADVTDSFRLFALPQVNMLFQMALM